jgi:hypothetical protein
MTCQTFSLLLISKGPIEGPMCDSNYLGSNLYPDLFEDPEVLIETLPFFAREIRCGTCTSLKESSPVGVIRVPIFWPKSDAVKPDAHLSTTMINCYR